MGSPAGELQLPGTPGGRENRGAGEARTPDVEDEESAVTHHPHPPPMSEEQQRARLHPYPHDVLRNPPAPNSPGRSLPPRSPMSRLGRSASAKQPDGWDSPL